MEQQVTMKSSLTTRLWFVARTIDHAELKMRDYFVERGIECFVPTRRELCKRRGALEDVEIPLVSNLVFFKTDYGLAHSLFNVNARRLYRIRYNGTMLTVPDQQMEPFMQFIRANYGKVKILDTLHVIGDKMIIKKGPFAGLVGKLIKIDNRDFFAISLDGILVAAVKVPKRDLAKVETGQ